MRFKITSAVCGALAALCGACAKADIWVSQFHLLEHLDTEGTVVDTVTGAFGEPFYDKEPGEFESTREGLIAGQVDPRDGSLVVLVTGVVNVEPRTGDTQAPLTAQTYAGLGVRSADWLRTRCNWG